MPHPIMFRDDDPVLAKVRKVALGFPEAYEKVSHGRPSFFVTKMFVMYGGSVKPETKGADYASTRTRSWSRWTRATVGPSSRIAGSSSPPTWVRRAGSGWTSRPTKKVDWDEVTELIDASFRLIAPKKLIKLLDEA